MSKLKEYKNIKDYYNNYIVKSLTEKYGYTNIMAVPKLEKIVVNRGLGEANTNSKVIEYTFNQFVALTGQIPVLTKSKKAISNFKIRENQVVGCKVTLRANKMYDFLTKFVNIVLPKIRDFRGVPTKSFDKNGNYTLGINEDSIFPEYLGEIDKERGFDISFITTAKTKEEAKDLLELLGLPFRKN